jgi:hypothetical protein
VTEPVTRSNQLATGGICGFFFLCPRSVSTSASALGYQYPVQRHLADAEPMSDCLSLHAFGNQLEDFSGSG